MTSPAFATLTELGTQLGGASPGTRGQQLLDLASAEIRRACNGQVLSQVAGQQEEYAGSDTERIIFLQQRPVTAVSEVEANGVVLATTSYEWRRWGALERMPVGSAWNDGPIVVTYDSGYPTDSDEYAALKAICLDVAVRAWEGTGGPNPFAVGEIPEAVGWTPHVSLTAEELGRLADFGAVPVG